MPERTAPGASSMTALGPAHPSARPRRTAPRWAVAAPAHVEPPAGERLAAVPVPRIRDPLPGDGRPRVDGKLLAVADRRLTLRGVTYGTFAEGADGTRFPVQARVEADFEAMTDAGVNAGHAAVLGYAIGNEIPAGIVRWHGRRRVERFLASLCTLAREADPEALVTYVS